MGGLPVLFKAMEHDPSLNVAMHAAWVLGTAVKNHATLQLNVSVAFCILVASPAHNSVDFVFCRPRGLVQC